MRNNPPLVNTETDTRVYTLSCLHSSYKLAKSPLFGEPGHPGAMSSPVTSKTIGGHFALFEWRGPSPITTKGMDALDLFSLLWAASSLSGASTTSSPHEVV